MDDPSDIIIYGDESEQIEEENDAYNDMRNELGMNQRCPPNPNNLFHSRYPQGCRRWPCRADAILLPSQHVWLPLHEHFKLLQEEEKSWYWACVEICLLSLV